MLEKELLELQYEVGSREKPKEKRQVIYNIFNLREGRVLVLIPRSSGDDDIPTPNSPCADLLPLKIMQFNLKDWKNGRHDVKWEKASIFLAITTENPFFQFATLHPDTNSQAMDNQTSDQGVNYDKNVHVADGGRSGLSDVARLTFASPWPLILIKPFSREEIKIDEMWIYPFKHSVIYEKQIRKFLELLNEINVDDVEAKSLYHNLSTMSDKGVRMLGPKRDDVENSETYVSMFCRIGGSSRITV